MFIRSAKKKAFKLEASQNLCNNSIKLVFHFNSKVKTAQGSQALRERVNQSVAPSCGVDSVASRIKTTHQRSQLVGIRASVMESNNTVYDHAKVQLASAGEGRSDVDAKPRRGHEHACSIPALRLSVMACRGNLAAHSNPKASTTEGAYEVKGSTAILWLTAANDTEQKSASVGLLSTASELLHCQLWCSIMLHSGNLSVTTVAGSDQLASSYTSSQSFMLLGGSLYGKEYSASDILKILTDYRLSCSADSGLGTEVLSVVDTGTLALQSGLDLARVLTPESLSRLYAKSLNPNTCPTIVSELSACMVAQSLTLIAFCQTSMLQVMSQLVFVLSASHRSVA